MFTDINFQVLEVKKNMNLKKDYKEFHKIVVLTDGTERLRDADTDMFDTISKVFGHDVWKEHVALVLTKVTMDEKSINKRIKMRKRSEASDYQQGEILVNGLKKHIKFGQIPNDEITIKPYYIDVSFDKDDKIETGFFLHETVKLYNNILKNYDYINNQILFDQNQQLSLVKEMEELNLYDNNASKEGDYITAEEIELWRSFFAPKLQRKGARKWRGKIGRDNEGAITEVQRNSLSSESKINEKIVENPDTITSNLLTENNSPEKDKKILIFGDGVNDGLHYLTILLNDMEDYSDIMVEKFDLDSYLDVKKNLDVKEIISSVKSKLGKKITSYNKIVIPINGNNWRIHPNMLNVFNIISGVFGREVWKERIAIVFNHNFMDENMIKLESYICGKRKLAKDYIEKLQQETRDKTGASIPFYFIDAYRKKSEDETHFYIQEAQRLYKDLEDIKPPIPKTPKPIHDYEPQCLCEKCWITRKEILGDDSFSYIEKYDKF